MKHNDFYTRIDTMLADPDFQSKFDTQEKELRKLRKVIKDADTPAWITTALTTMHATFPEGTSLRYRSSTNNEDLPNFNGAGLYDSKTQHPEETEEDGIDKSLKQVFASLWTFRALHRARVLSHRSSGRGNGGAGPSQLQRRVGQRGRGQLRPHLRPRGICTT